jgi:RNA recognition motif-containing protein
MTFLFLKSNFRIVEFATRDDAQKAIATLSNTNFMGRQIFVREVFQHCACLIGRIENRNQGTAEGLIVAGILHMVGIPVVATVVVVREEEPAEATVIPPAVKSTLATYHIHLHN